VDTVIELSFVGELTTLLQWHQFGQSLGLMSSTFSLPQY